MTPLLMSPIMSDLRCTQFGISSPRSCTEGYSCAFPSWPNRPCLDSRSADPIVKKTHHSVPSIEFLETLRRRARPDSVFDNDSDDEEVDDDSDAPAAAARPAQRSNSLLSRAFSQLRDSKPM